MRHAFRISLLIVSAVVGTVRAQTPDPAFRLYGTMAGTTTLLVDTTGATVHTWPSSYRPGLAVYLLDDGTLLRTINTGFLPGIIGGTGGGVQKLALDGTVLWDFRYDGPGVWSHHDVEPLPNGNVLMIAWEDKTPEEAVAEGRNPALITSTVFRPDHIIEVQPTGPTSGTIVWEWHVWDHLIQDFDPAKANYGVVGNHPELVDINYPPAAIQSNDWIHMNGVGYDPVHDWIILSANRLSEVWIIDHGTTTQEARGHTGGRYGVGGDLLYRWGNPAAYRRGTRAQQQLFGQHAAYWIPAGYPGAGNILLFNNNHPAGSAAWEFVLPLDAAGRFILDPGQPYGPAGPVWTHAGGFQSATTSSAQRARNGNTLICSGAQGVVLEVTPQGQQVWAQSLFGGIFHAHYVEHRLWADRSSLSLSQGGTVGFDLIAGGEHAGDVYFVLGSASGTSPGVTIHGQHVPLNVDPYFFTTLSQPGIFPFGQTLGTLDGFGRATASFGLPPGLTGLNGLHLDHAFVVLDPMTVRVKQASNAVPLDLVQ